MTPLEGILKGFIEAHGVLPLGAYMAQALYHAEYGYYTRGLNFTGDGTAETEWDAPRDFVTAPEMTPLLGQVLARVVGSLWRELGEPSPFALVEFGPGRAVLMRDMLRALRADDGACFAAARPTLVETSPVLQKVQEAILAEFGECVWQSGVACDLPMVGVGNEILDAFPVQPYRLQNGVWEWQVVDVGADGALGLKWAEAMEAPEVPAGWAPVEGTLLDVSRPMTVWLQELKAALKARGGAVVLLDYGAGGLPPMGASTVQAVRGHTVVDILDTPGEADITAHVNFGHVADVLCRNHCRPLEDMAGFLMANGVVDLALKATEKDQLALQRLLHPAQMGKLFKVLTCVHPSPHPL